MILSRRPLHGQTVPNLVRRLFGKDDPETLMRQAIAAWKQDDRTLFFTALLRADHAALAIVSPGFIVDADAVARRVWDWPQRIALTTSGEIALASMHKDGRLRAEAIELMTWRPELLPFLAVRTSDWVGPVRSRALEILTRWLHLDPVRMLPQLAPIALLLQRRERAALLAAHVSTAMLSAPRQTLQDLLKQHDTALRRLAFNMLTFRDLLSPKQLVELAMSDQDVKVRALAAERAAKEAVWRQAPDAIKPLTRSKLPMVRANGLLAMIRCGQLPLEFLGDPAPVVRALARDAASRQGIDVPAWYREQVTAAPTPGVIAGLGEAGLARDVPLLAGFLDDPSKRRRTAATRAFEKLKKQGKA